MCAYIGDFHGEKVVTSDATSSDLYLTHFSASEEKSDRHKCSDETVVFTLNSDLDGSVAGILNFYLIREAVEMSWTNRSRNDVMIRGLDPGKDRFFCFLLCSRNVVPLTPQAGCNLRDISEPIKLQRCCPRPILKIKVLWKKKKLQREKNL